MKRRALLQTLAAASVGVAGCLDRQTTGTGTTEQSSTQPAPTKTDGPPTPPETYELCDRFVIPVGMLPTPVESEVDAALRGGSVTKSRILVAEVMDVETSYLWRDDTYYRATVTGTKQQTLQAVAVERPTFPEPLTVYVRNEADESHEITIRFRYGGEQVYERTLTLGSGHAERIDAVQRFGEYELLVEVAGYDAYQRDIRFDEVHFGPEVVVEADGIWSNQAVGQPPECPWPHD